MTSARVRSLAGHSLLAAASLVVWFAVIEIGLRVAGYRPEPPVATLFAWSANGELWFLPPSSKSGTLVGGYPVEVNSLGLRDREIEPKTMIGSRRILFLGDSVTFGHGQPIEAIFVRQLEDILRRQGSIVQVVSAAIPGWSTRQERLFHRTYGTRVQADLVLVGLVLNDLPASNRPRVGGTSPPSTHSPGSRNVRRPSPSPSGSTSRRSPRSCEWWRPSNSSHRSPTHPRCSVP